MDVPRLAVVVEVLLSLFLPEVTPDATGACVVEVEPAGLFRSPNKLDDGAGADEPVGLPVTVVLGVRSLELVVLSAGLPRFANSPPAVEALACVAELGPAAEVPRLLNRLCVPLPPCIVAGADNGCVVGAAVEEGKLNAGLGFVEDAVPLAGPLNKEGVVS